MIRALCAAIALLKGLVSFRVGPTKVRRIKMRKSSFGIIAASLALALACLPASAADSAAGGGIGEPGSGIGEMGFSKSDKMIVAVVWTCEAHSDTGAFGVGMGPIRSIAARTAMNYCRANTPEWGVCYVTNCAWEHNG